MKLWWASGVSLVYQRSGWWGGEVWQLPFFHFECCIHYSYRMQLFCVTFSLSATFQIFDSHITWVIALLSSSLDLIAGLRNASAVAFISCWQHPCSTAGHESRRKRLRSELRCLPTLFMSLRARTVPRNCTVHCRPEHPADACMLVIKRLGKKNEKRYLTSHDCTLVRNEYF